MKINCQIKSICKVLYNIHQALHITITFLVKNTIQEESYTSTLFNDTCQALYHPWVSISKNKKMTINLIILRNFPHTVITLSRKWKQILGPFIFKYFVTKMLRVSIVNLSWLSWNFKLIRYCLMKTAQFKTSFSISYSKHSTSIKRINGLNWMIKLNLTKNLKIDINTCYIMYIFVTPSVQYTASW